MDTQKGGGWREERSGWSAWGVRGWGGVWGARQVLMVELSTKEAILVESAMAFRPGN